MKHNYIEIGERRIGLDYNPLIVAEIGINHGGSFETAIKMVDSAYRAGAEVIKHQMHICEEEMYSDAEKIIPANANQSIYDLIRKCQLSNEDEYNLKKYVESKNMLYISTPFSIQAGRFLNEIGVKAFKIGSGECNNLPLVESICQYGKPIIVSTGMNDIDSINRTVNVIEKYKIPYALLQCTSLYPTTPQYIRLGAMQELMLKFPNAVVGLSDHSVNNNASIAAVALGASIIERHFTDSKTRPGPDISCSMDPKELFNLIRSANEVFQMRGGKKEVISEEICTMNFAFSSVVAVSDIVKGEMLTRENIAVKRPNTGEINAYEYYNILGKKAKNNILRDTPLKWSEIE